MGVTTPAELVEVQSVGHLRGLLAPHREQGARIGFVPTMGALHDGHAELLRQARSECDVVVCSCYVNPTQFGPGEDLARYPRTPERDRAVVADAGADVLWRPTDADVYGPDPEDATVVHVGSLARRLEGARRPGHFDGVATVVVRLLGAVAPRRLYVGAKDFQQVVVLRRVLSDLLVDVDVVVVPTQRESDGLALSSRNAYLTAEERRAASRIPAALDVARRLAGAGERSSGRLEGAARELLSREPQLEVDYVELCDARTLLPTDLVQGRDAVLLVAVRVGTTRLIDNLQLPATPTTPREATT